MSKKSILEREKKRKKIVLKFLDKRKNLISKFKKEKDFNKKQEISFIIQKMSRNSSQVRLVNRCFLTGRNRSVYSLFNLSKSSIKNLAYKSFLPGITLSSW